MAPELYRGTSRGRRGEGIAFMKITALIVDDEEPARDELAFLLKSFPDVEIVGRAKNDIMIVQGSAGRFNILRFDRRAIGTNRYNTLQTILKSFAKCAKQSISFIERPKPARNCSSTNSNNHRLVVRGPPRRRLRSSPTRECGWL